MYEYRVTKFDPAHRAADGTFQAPAWTSASDIGKRFAGLELTVQAYLAKEALYIRAIETAIRIACVEDLRLTDLESFGTAQPTSLPPLDLGVLDGPTEGLSVLEASTLACAILREIVWGKLEGSNRFYVHFGWDYYMYIGGAARQLENFSPHGVFVEPFKSPHDLVAEGP